jgi:hypothetical protein
MLVFIICASYNASLSSMIRAYICASQKCVDCHVFLIRKKVLNHISFIVNKVHAYLSAHVVAAVICKR